MKVLNFGSLNVDYVYNVDHMMLPGETQASYDMKIFLGGKGFNQSTALAKAGVSVYHAGIVGTDGDGFFAASKEYGIHTDYIKRVEDRSGHTIIQVDKDGQNCILLHGGSNRQITHEFVDEVLENFGEGDVLLLQNEINNLDYIIDCAYAKKMIIVLNPSPYNDALNDCDMKKISYFLLNEIEGEQLTGETEPDKIIDTILQKYPLAKTVLTLGKDGAIYADSEQRYEQPIYKTQAVDTTAAGDTFTGYFIAGIVNEMPINEILDMCAMASSITVSRKGASPSIPFMDELKQAIAEKTK